MKNNKKIYFILSLLIAIFCISIVNRQFENDTFSAIKIGDYILNNGIDFVEHFNIDNNLVWHNSRWLFNVAIAFIYNSFGFLGIHVFVLLMSTLLGLVIFNCLNKQNNNMFLSFILTILAMFPLDAFVSARAQVISYIFFVFEVYSIEKMISTKKLRYPIYIIISSILVANIHTTVWPMTIIFFLPYLAEYILSKFKMVQKIDKIYFEKIDIKFFMIIFVLTILSGLCTPLGLTPYTYMFKTMNGISSNIITELFPINFFDNYEFIIYSIIYIFFLIYLKVKVKLSDLFMLIGLYIMSITAVRNSAFLYIISPFIISRLIKEATIDIMPKFKAVFNYLSKQKVIYIILLVPFILISLFNFNANNKHDYVNKAYFPVGASDYIDANIDISKMRLYNGFNFGSYLEFRGYKVFLDSRSEVYCKEFNNTSILEDYDKVASGDISYKKIFDKYNFTHILLYKNELVNNYIQDDSDYKKIYSDNYFYLYEKK